jgi:hypothetical protein
MIKLIQSKETTKALDKLISDFKNERAKMLDFLFESTLSGLLETKKLDYILDK